MMHTYAALGDSITFGQQASCPWKAYPARIDGLLRSEGIDSHTAVFARPGWTSADLAAHLHAHPELPSAARVVSVWIGGDDLIRYGLSLLRQSKVPIDKAVRQYRHQLESIIGMSRARGPRAIVLCTQYNPFPNSPIALQAIGTLNRAILDSAQTTGCAVARMDQRFAGREAQLIHGYRNGEIEGILHRQAGVHPNDRGHRVIAETLYPFVRQQFHRNR